MISEAVMVALVSGGLTLVGVLASNNAKDAVVNQKIEDLTREVREHNNFARRVPVMENDIATMKKDIDDLKKGA